MNLKGIKIFLKNFLCAVDFVHYVIIAIQGSETAVLLSSSCLDLHIYQLHSSLRVNYFQGAILLEESTKNNGKQME